MANAATQYLYSGEQFDARIGQQYLRARYYDQSTGTFNRLDPFFGNLTDPQSFNKYRYTHGDPIQFADPSGNSESISLVTAIGIQVAGFAVAHPTATLIIAGTLSLLSVYSLIFDTEARELFFATSAMPGGGPAALIAADIRTLSSAARAVWGTAPVVRNIAVMRFNGGDPRDFLRKVNRLANAARDGGLTGESLGDTSFWMQTPDK